MKQRKFHVLAVTAVAALLGVGAAWADDRAKTDQTPIERATTEKKATTDKKATADKGATTDKAGTTDKNQVDRATIDKSEIIGNRELPKVLYIVPWKKPAAGELAGPPVESVLDEALAPIDRDVFRRQVRYNTLMNPAVSAPPSSGADTASPAPSRN